MGKARRHRCAAHITRFYRKTSAPGFNASRPNVAGCGRRRIRPRATDMSARAMARQRGFLGIFQYVTLIGAMCVMVVLHCDSRGFPTASCGRRGWRIQFFSGQSSQSRRVVLRASLTGHVLGKKAASRKELALFVRFSRITTGNS